MDKKLYAPKSYWEANEAQRNEICNGCGAKDGIKVPDTIYGVCIRKACDIHDWMYQHGTTLADKMFADAMFRMNMATIIDNNSNFIMGPIRNMRASKYYVAVVEWGDEAFWVKKPKNKIMKITFSGDFR